MERKKQPQISDRPEHINNLIGRQQRRLTRRDARKEAQEEAVDLEQLKKTTSEVSHGTKILGKRYP